MTTNSFWAALRELHAVRRASITLLKNRNISIINTIRERGYMFSFLYSLYGIYDLILNLLEDYFRLIRGVWKLSKLRHPVVSIFGGTKLSQEHPYALDAHKLSAMLLVHGISVITGGGPGIMQAANCSGLDQDPDLRGKSIGIGVEGLDEEHINTCMDELIITRYFFARKWLLTHFADAFAVFPGGFGTLDELSEVLTQMQTGKLERVPVVLINKAYWKPFMEWVATAEKEGLLSKKDAELIFVTDDIKEAFNHLYKHCSH